MRMGKEADTPDSMMLHGSYVYGMACICVALAIIGGYVARTLARRISAARNDEARFRTLAEAIPEIVWTASPEGTVDYANRRLTELTGLSPDRVKGMSWQQIIHPDDLPVALQKWENSLRTGTVFEIEYRVRVASGDYRWYLIRATPMRDAVGKIVKWFGSGTDIDNQMRTQQVLEEQIKQHTDALVEANTRLETEMRERSQAQQELNRQNELMLRELTKRSNRATRLAKLAELLQSCADLQDVFSVVAGMAPKIFPELRGAVLLFNTSRDVLEVAASWSDCVVPASVFAPHDCWALRTGHMHRVTAGDHTANCKHVGDVSHSYFCLPLISQGEAIGVLHFQCIGATEPPDSEMLVAGTFGEQVGLSVSNLRLREALRSQSIRDPLTSLFNRRYLEEMMERETRRAVRAEHGLGVLMLDLDHFKRFNDTYGHDAGDTVLRETAAFLVKSVRAEDIVCRYGGEEFVVILPMADLKATHARAERIRSKLREMIVLHQGQSVGMITVSIGVGALPEHGTAPKALLEAADGALYRAKNEGRDRVAVADAPVLAEVQSSAIAMGASKE
ncbi:MAG TPA: diguanylate cyclase [Candidatus Dormibacteraeota bacterium]|nr:diguanylate cyclase [Candidatus Dormibacteraeota bacterium]